MALTFQQFKTLRDKGLTVEQIARFETGEKPKTTEISEISNRNEEKKPGFIQSVVQGLTKPVLTTVATGASLVKGVGALANAGIDSLVGNKDQAKKDMQEAAKPVNIDAGYFGKARPIGVDDEGKTASIKQVVKEATGTGAQLASYKMGLVSGGAAYSGGQELSDNKSLKEAGISTAGGAVLGLATKGIGNAISKAPETAWSSILKRTPTAAVKNPELEKAAAQQGIVGMSRESISGTLGKKIQQIELQIDDVLNTKSGNIPTWSVAEKLRGLHDAYSKIPGETETAKAIIGIADDFLGKGKTITVQEANKLKREIYGVISKTYGKGLLEVPAKRESQKLIARGLKEQIEMVIPEIKDLNQRQAILIQMKKAIDATIARQEGKGIAGTGIGLFDLMIGGGFGIGINPMVGLGAALTKKTAESSGFLSASGLGFQKLINFWNKLSPTKKILFYNGLRGIEGETINQLGGKKE